MNPFGRVKSWLAAKREKKNKGILQGIKDLNTSLEKLELAQKALRLKKDPTELALFCHNRNSIRKIRKEIKILQSRLV